MTDELIRNENPETSQDKRFQEWCDKAAKLLGVNDLDGDEKEDGYSLDSAFDAFTNEITPLEYSEKTVYPTFDMDGCRFVEPDPCD